MRSRVAAAVLGLLVAMPVLAAPARDAGPFPCPDETGKWGYIDGTGAFVIPPQYQAAEAFSEGLALVILPDDRAAFIDPSGKVAFEGTAADPFCGGVAVVNRFWVEPDLEDPMGMGIPHSSFHMIDRHGKRVGKAEYTRLAEMREGLAAAGDDKGFGFVDARGRRVVPFRYESSPGDFSEGLASVTVKGKVGFIDRKGVTVIRPAFDEAGDFHDGFALVVQGNRRFFIDRKGRPAFSGMLLKTSSWETRFSEGLAPVQTANDLKGLMDPTGRLAVDGAQWTWQHFRAFCGGLAAVSVRVQDRLLWGFVDTQGRAVIAPQFEAVSDFEGPLARVELGGGRLGYVDRTGKLVREYRGRDW